MSLAGRPSVRVDHVYGWRLVENPDFPAEHDDLVVSCHDGSTFLTLRCGHCGEDMHIHKTQVAGIKPGDEVLTRCKGSCGRPMVLGGKYLITAFAEVEKRMRSTRA